MTREEMRRSPATSPNRFFWPIAGAVACLLVLGAAVAMWTAGPKKEPNGIVSIESDVVEAQFLIDGEEVGKVAPISKELRAGEHKLEVRKVGYQRFDKLFRVNGGRKPMVVQVRLEPVSNASALVIIVTNPPDAEIQLNGEVKRQRGKGPEIWHDEVAPEKSLTLLIRATGFADWRKELTLIPGAREAVMARLEKLTVTLQVSSDPAGAEIRLDGKRVGRTPKEIAGLDGITPFKISLRKPCYQEFSTTIAMDGASRDIAQRLVPKPGCLGANAAQ